MGHMLEYVWSKLMLKYVWSKLMLKKICRERLWFTQSCFNMVKRRRFDITTKSSWMSSHGYDIFGDIDSS